MEMKFHIFLVLFGISIFIAAPIVVGIFLWWVDWMSFFFTEILPRPEWRY